MSTKSGAVAGISPRLSAAYTSAIADHVRCVGCRLAGDVSGVELRDGGVEVVDVEHDNRRHPLVGIDLDDCEHLDAERVGPLVASRKSVMSQGEALCACRDDR